MSEINIHVQGGTSKRLLTAGKYCDRDIVVTAQGGADIKHAKFIAAPTSTATFTIDNPLGGLAKFVSVRKVTPVTGSSRKIDEYLLSADLGIGVMGTSSASDAVSYAVRKASESPGNSQFSVSDGRIILKQYSSAVGFVSNAEYEVEIYQ